MKNMPYVKNTTCKREKLRRNWWISKITVKIWIWRSFIKLHNEKFKK